ncbi:hypothetical protein THRCLA_04709 [Thraustotheca clavata]|uniref:Protein kinase domain-containing protein n=1 Tax=Thraustotheca clavata TaxID=74557 RepID=A0A1V9ZY88_9STRA|nr:hypothetical protein THRCLA_04709 [Thraustotheca clavata]
MFKSSYSILRICDIRSDSVCRSVVNGITSVQDRMERRQNKGESRLKDIQKSTISSTNRVRSNQQPHQNSVKEVKPKSTGAFKSRTIEKTKFRYFYDRGDLPLRVNFNGAVRKVQWQVDITTLDYTHYLPLFFEGLRELDEPYKFLALNGTLDLLEKGGDRPLTTIPHLILPMKQNLMTRNPLVLCIQMKVLQKLVLLCPYAGEALVPYYRQLLTIFNLFITKRVNCGDAIDYGQQRNENLGDLITETLYILERHGGEDAFVNIKYMIPTYESCVIKGIDHTKLKQVSLLGRGCSGNVVKAHDSKSNKFYAIKTVNNVYDKSQRNQIITEIQTLYSIRIPWLVDFYGAYFKDQALSLILEYCDMGSLDNVVKKIGPIPESILACMTFQILSGLQHLQNQRHFHRDIKPQNILLTTTGYVKLTDFGLARELNGTFDMANTFVGTFKYMSPERVVQSIIEGPPPALSDKEFSDEFRDFLDACLKKNTRDRSSADELLYAPWLEIHEATGCFQN